MPAYPLPIPDSYWVEPGRLLAGEYPARFQIEQTRKRLDALLEAGIDTFIDLTVPEETIPYTGILAEQAKIYEREVVHFRFPIGDFGLPTIGNMNAILNQIERSLLAGRGVYLHCQGGIGRTGTVVGCYLVRRGRTAEEALEQLAAWWRGVPKSRVHPRSPETAEQWDFIRRWAAHDEKSGSGGD